MRWCWLLIVLAMAACGDTSSTVEPQSLAPEVRFEQTVSGKPTYDLRCASCHQDGKAGAPKTGDPETWSNRSPLWMAVLAEHAKKGYLQMPAQGGDADISDAEIEAATEYMLSQTYPELPLD